MLSIRCQLPSLFKFHLFLKAAWSALTFGASYVWLVDWSTLGLFFFFIWCYFMYSGSYWNCLLFHNWGRFLPFPFSQLSVLLAITNESQVFFIIAGRKQSSYRKLHSFWNLWILGDCRAVPESIPLHFWGCADSWGGDTVFHQGPMACSKDNRCLYDTSGFLWPTASQGGRDCFRWITKEKMNVSYFVSIKC